MSLRLETCPSPYSSFSLPSLPTCLRTYLGHSAEPQLFSVVCLGWHVSLSSMTPVRKKAAWMHLDSSFLLQLCWGARGSFTLAGMVGLICGSVWQLSPWLGRYLCQSTVDFMLLLLKPSFPNRASSSSHWLNLSIWSCARFFFSLGNHALHQKICCHKKTKLFLRALFWGFEIVAPAWNLIFPQMLIPGKGKQAWRRVHCALWRARVPKPFPHSPLQGLLH